MSNQTITQTHTLPDGRIYRAMLEVFLPSPANQVPYVKVHVVRIDDEGNVLVDSKGFPQTVGPDTIPLDMAALMNGSAQALDGYAKMLQPLPTGALDNYPLHESLPTTDEGLVRVGDDLYQWKIGLYSLIIQNVLAGIPALQPTDTMTDEQMRALLGLA